MNMRFSVVSTHFYRGQIAGHLVRVQVHRNVGGHQSQCGRAAGRSAVADPAEAGESGEVAVGVLCLSGQLYHHQLTPLVFCCWKSVTCAAICSGSAPVASTKGAHARRWATHVWPAAAEPIRRRQFR